jgi:hypothetical protein
VWGSIRQRARPERLGSAGQRCNGASADGVMQDAVLLKWCIPLPGDAAGDGGANPARALRTSFDHQAMLASSQRMPSELCWQRMRTLCTRVSPAVPSPAAADTPHAAA